MEVTRQTRKTTTDPQTRRLQATHGRLYQALYKSKDIPTLANAIEALRQAGDFQAIDKYCSWVAETARVEILAEGVFCRGQVVDGAGRGLNFHLTFKSSKFSGDHKAALVNMYSDLVSMYAHTSYFETLFKNSFLVFQYSHPCVVKKHNIFVGDITSEFFSAEYTHEAGHTLLFSIEEENSQASNSFILMLHLINGIAKARKVSWVVKESTFLRTKPHYGHPQDNPHELFASSINAFCLHAASFAEMILSGKNIDEIKFGRLIWGFLRDELFSGQVFLDKDPLKNVNWREELRFAEIAKMLRITRLQLAPNNPYKFRPPDSL